jgi:hypothetical protein
MKITGGNLRLLFWNYSLAELENYFMKTVRAIKFTPTPSQYFDATGTGEDAPYDRAFSCLPTKPFSHPGNIGYVSNFVERMLGALKPDDMTIPSDQENSDFVGSELWSREESGGKQDESDVVLEP